MKPDWPACSAALAALFAGILPTIAISLLPLAEMPSWIANILFVVIAALVLNAMPSRSRIRMRHILAAGFILAGLPALLLYIGIRNFSSPLAATLTRPAQILLHVSQIGDAWFPIIVGIVTVVVLVLSMLAYALFRLLALVSKHANSNE